MSDVVGPLPEPVERYLRFAGVRARRALSAVRLEQRGDFLFARRWRAFHAVQVIDPAGPAFTWQASIALAPPLRVKVEDSYRDGVGRIDARLAGIIPVMHREDGAELAIGELHRYLAEAVWNPAILAPGNGVQWTLIDRHSARATLTAHGHTVSLDFHFDVDGRPLKAYTPGRYRDVDGTFVLTPWLCEYGPAVRLNRQMVPRTGEVSWLLPKGQEPYCRLEVTAIRNLAGAPAHTALLKHLVH